MSPNQKAVFEKHNEKLMQDFMTDLQCREATGEKMTLAKVLLSLLEYKKKGQEEWKNLCQKVAGMNVPEDEGNKGG